MEYLIVHRGGRGSTIVYELAYDGKGSDGERFLPGMIDLQTSLYDEKKSGLDDEKSAPSRGQVGQKSAPSRGDEISKSLDEIRSVLVADDDCDENAPPTRKNGSSYRSGIAAKSR